MECFTPAFPRDETEEGELSFDMDGDLGLWNREFSYHPYGEPIPFETEGHVLSLYPGFDEVSLHVRAPTRPLRMTLKDSVLVIPPCLFPASKAESGELLHDHRHDGGRRELRR